jgi:hypothetical protein
MKCQLFLVALVALSAFAAPLPEYEVDPDCIEEDLSVVEPQYYEAGLMEPELVIEINEPAVDYDCEDPVDPTSPEPIVATEECEDPIDPTDAPTTPAPVVATEECEDPLPSTTPEPIVATEPGCEEEPTTQAPQEIVDDCEDEEGGVENVPLYDWVIEKAEIIPDQIIGEDFLEPIEECDE